MNLLKKILLAAILFLLICTSSVTTNNLLAATTDTSESNEDIDECFVHKVDLQTGTESTYEIDNDVQESLNFYKEAIAPSIISLESSVISPYNLNSIIGTDDRTLVTDTSQYPYTCVARLTITYTNGNVGYGSGCMISKRLLATAGHCLIDDDGSHAQIIKAEFGLNGSYCFYTTTDVSTYIYYGGYNGYNSATDYGFVYFNSNVGNITGSFGVNTAISVNDTIHTAGYPGDLSSGQCMYETSGTVSYVDVNILHFDLDVMGGQSGSPLYIIGTDDNPYLVGMVSGSTDEYNVGRRLNYGLFTWLEDNGYFE